MLTLLPIPMKSEKSKVFTERKMLKAIKNSFGIVSHIANLLKCSRYTAMLNVRYYESTIQLFEDEEEELADDAMFALRRLIKEGEPATVRWALKNLRPERFSDELPGIVDQSITLNITLPDDMSAADAAIVATKLKKLKAGR